jgi:hypothetical protein
MSNRSVATVMPSLTLLPLNKADYVEGADLIVCCPDTIGSQPSLSYGFMVSSRQLRANSSVFDNLMQDATPNEKAYGLPVVRVTEPANVMGFLLSAACNVASSIYLPRLTTDHTILMPVWEACNKYEMLFLRSQIVICLE